MSRRRRGGMKIPILVIAGMAPLAGNAIGEIKAGGWAAGLRNTVKYIAPYDAATGQFTAAYLGGGLIPLAVTYVVHRLAAPINRVLAGSGLPIRL